MGPCSGGGGWQQRNTPPKLGGPPDLGDRNANDGMLSDGGHNAAGTVVSAPDRGLLGDGSKHSLPSLRSANQEQTCVLRNHNQQPNHSCFMHHRNSGRELSCDQLPRWWRRGGGGAAPLGRSPIPTELTLPRMRPPSRMYAPPRFAVSRTISPGREELAERESVHLLLHFPAVH